MSGSGERERGEDSEVRGKEEAVVDAERGRALRFVPQSVSAPVTFPPPPLCGTLPPSLSDPPPCQVWADLGCHGCSYHWRRGEHHPLCFLWWGLREQRVWIIWSAYTTRPTWSLFIKKKKKVLIILSVHTKKSWDILDILREVVNNPATCFVFVGIDSPLLILLIRSLLNQLCSDGFFFVCVPEVEHRSPEWLCYPSKCHVCATVLKFDARVWSGRWGGGLFGLITSVFERIFFFFCHEVVLNIIQGLALGKHEGTVLKNRGDQNPVCLLYHSAEHKVPFQHSTL